MKSLLFPLLLLPKPWYTGVVETVDDEDGVVWVRPRGDEVARGEDRDVRRSCEPCRRLELRTKL
jgi:hypothetical protein